MQENKIYKSPLSKQVIFLKKSRARWKAKCRQSKAIVKGLKNRVRYLEESRRQWKDKAKKLEADFKQKLVELEAELAQKQIELEKTEQELQRIKKNSESLGQKLEIASLKDFPVGHQYSYGQIMLFILLVLSAGTTLRAASRVMKIISDYLSWPLKTPSWFTGRLWILRLGYYKLMRPKEKAADWVWIADHTIQLGVVKCLVIVGLRLSTLSKNDSYLSYKELEPIALLPVTQSNGQIIYQQLEEAAQITGVPREIIADHGSDLKSGIKKFCVAHQQTAFIYDIKHKSAAVLKQTLKDDPDWTEFRKLASQTKVNIQQTSLAALAPPNQRTKARFMNLDLLINWGCKMLIFLDKETKQPHEEFDSRLVSIKLGWVASFSEQLKEWKGLLELVTVTEIFVRKQGFYQNCHQQLQPLLKARTLRERKVQTELLTFVAEEATKCKEQERLLGSSEIIESLFGKFKRLEQEQVSSGFTALLLSLPAMLSVTDSEVIQTALSTVPTQKVLSWQSQFIVKSLQGQRRFSVLGRNKYDSNLKFYDVFSR